MTRVGRDAHWWALLRPPAKGLLAVVLSAVFESTVFESTVAPMGYCARFHTVQRRPRKVGWYVPGGGSKPAPRVST